MKITVWLVTRERTVWITSAEVLGLALVLVAGPGTLVGTVVGLMLLSHLGYTALTSLPLGAIPGRPVGAKRHRRNQDLRSEVVGFLNEVRRVEEYVKRAKDAGLPPAVVEENLRDAERRMRVAAAEVVKVTGRSTYERSDTEVVTGRRSVTLLTHQRPRHGPSQAH